MKKNSHTFKFEGRTDSKGRHATAQGLIKTGDTVEITFLGAREQPVSLKRWNPVWEMEDSVDVMGEVFYFRIIVNEKSHLLGQWADYRYTEGSSMGGGVRYSVERTAIGDEQVADAYAGMVKWLAEGAKENNYWHSLNTPESFPMEAVTGMPGERVSADEGDRPQWEPDKVYDEGFGVFSVNGLRYRLRDNGLQLMPLLFGAKYSGDLEIPDHVTYRKQSYPVTEIRRDAFEGCNALSSIRVPGTLESFFTLPTGDPPLKAIHVGDGCRRYSSRDGILFSQDGGKLVKYPRLREEEEYVVPDCVTSIEEEAFSGARALCRVKFPDGLKYIENHAFENCTSLESVVLPPSIRQVSGSAFRNCCAIQSFSFPPERYFDLSGVPSIAFPWGKPAFVMDGLTFTPFLDKDHPCLLQVRVSVADENKEWAAGVEELSIPARVQQYGNEYSVSECDLDFDLFPSIKKLSIPNSMRKISLTRCRAAEVILDPWNVFFYLEGCLLLDNELTRIVSVVKGMCPRKLTVPEGVEKVGNFSGIDEELEEVVLPDTVTTLEADCFKGCRSLRRIHLGAGLKNVGRGAFSNCGITSLTLPTSLNRMPRDRYSNEYSLFSGCDSLEEFRMEGEGEVYLVKDGVLYRKYGRECVLCFCPPKLAWEEFEVPEGTEYIEFGAFTDNTVLKEIVFPDSLKKIEAWAFRNCTSLEVVLFNPELEEISANAFSCCTSLKALALPQSLERLDHSAFSGCKNLGLLRLPRKFEHDRSKYLQMARG